MVQTRNGTAVAVRNGGKALRQSEQHPEVVTIAPQENLSSVPNLPRDAKSKLFACLVLVGISWAMVVCNVIINIRNGQRLSIDDHGWLMNGLIVGTLSLAPTAAVGFAGFHWARGRKLLALVANLAAIPLVAFNLWSASEYVGDQMLGRQQLHEQRFASNQQLAELSNAEVMRSKREAETSLWKAWSVTTQPKGPGSRSSSNRSAARRLP